MNMTTSIKVRYQKKRKRRLYISACLVSLSLYVLLDLTLASVCKDLCPALWMREHRTKFRIRDQVFHHTLAPNILVVDRWGDRYFHLATNNLGFRDARPRHVELRSDDRRFLFIGDSFTEGQGVTWEESFVGRIQTALHGQNTEVLNAGVSSYAPANYYSKVRHFIAERGLSVDHVFVFVDISDIKSSIDQYLVTNDHRAIGRFDPPKSDPFYTREVRKWLKQNTVTVPLLYKFRDLIVYRLKKKKIFKHSEELEVKNIPKKMMQDTEHNAESSWCFIEENKLASNSFDVVRGIEMAQKHMTLLYDFLSEREINLSLVIYPWPANIANRARGGRCETIWQSWAIEHGVDLINLFDVFMTEENPISVVRRYFISNDVHWNANGHKLVSQSILDHIKKMGLVR